MLERGALAVDDGEPRRDALGLDGLAVVSAQARSFGEERRAAAASDRQVTALGGERTVDSA
ncbi:MAG TPA: hypothetical protein VK281_21395 [Xanthobacteraceae bacterium]|nr:hypothetical protein [Xanthobacteraceae bacterium]